LLACLIAALLALSLAGQFSKYVLGHGNLKGLVGLFDVDGESSLPTWYSSAALALAALLLAAAAAVHRWRRLGDQRAWAGLAALVLLLSVDEVAGIHECAIEPLRSAWNLSGVWYYAWVIPGMALVAIVGLAYARFWWRLPPRTRWWFLVAAAVFVGGALGVEMVSAAWASAHGEQNLTYALIISVEEAMEMSGVAILICAVAHYLQIVAPDLALLATCTSQGPHSARSADRPGNP
jgi:hypothetical protein